MNPKLRGLAGQGHLLGGRGGLKQQKLQLNSAPEFQGGPNTPQALPGSANPDWPLVLQPQPFSPSPPQHLFCPRGSPTVVHPSDLIPSASQWRGHPSPWGSHSLPPLSAGSKPVPVSSLGIPPPSSIQLPCKTRHQTPIISSLHLSTYIHGVVLSFPP